MKYIHKCLHTLSAYAWKTAWYMATSSLRSCDVGILLSACLPLEANREPLGPPLPAPCNKEQRIMSQYSTAQHWITRSVFLHVIVGCWSLLVLLNQVCKWWLIRSSVSWFEKQVQVDTKPIVSFHNQCCLHNTTDCGSFHQCSQVDGYMQLAIIKG